MAWALVLCSWVIPRVGVQAGRFGQRQNTRCDGSAGDADRYYRAFDIRTGDVLWETRLGAAAHGYPITYEVAGRQFIAVPASLPGVLRGLAVQLSPEIYLPEGGNALYVFALPE